MDVRPELLCLGHDPLLNRTRSLILQKAFNVTSVDRTAEALALLSRRDFRLVLICSSVGDEDARAVVEQVLSRNGSSRILALSDGRRRLGLEPPHEEFLPYGPEDLLRRAASLAGITPPPIPGVS